MAETTTIRVARDVKEDLDELLRSMKADLEHEVTLSEVLAQLVRLCRRYPLDCWDVTDEGPALDAWRRFVARIPDLGYETDAANLDRDLYRDE